MSLLLFLFACGLEAADSATTYTCDRTPPLTYDNFGRGYLEMHCNGCHSSLLPEAHRVGAPANVDFDNKSMVLEWADRIEARATGDLPTMPPGGGPTPTEVAQLEEWLYCTLLPQVTTTSESQE
jgi:uncharacterized membrane protein